MPRFGGARTRFGVSLYLCFVDESGTHGGSPVLVVGGIIVHEEDAWHLQQRLDSFLFRKLRPLGHDHTMFEIHAAEMWRGRKRWASVVESDRRRILAGAYATLAGYAPVNPALPWRLIGAVMERNPHNQKLRAYELLTKKFDDFVNRMSRQGHQQRGLIVHDQSNVEGSLQNWTNQWRTASSSLGRLRNLADVPLFADSRATRALQAADLVAYALFRYYLKPGGRPDERYARRLWTHFDADGGRMHGLIHDSDYFGSCTCPACASRR